MGPRGAKRAGSVPEWRNLSQGPFSFSEFATAFSHATGWSLRILLLIDRRSPRKVRLQSNPDGNVGGHDSSTSGLGSLIRCPQCLRFDPAVLKRLECSLELLRIRCCNGLTAIFVPMRCENEPVAVLFGGWVFVGEVMPPRFKRFAQPGITGGIMAVSERRLDAYITLLTLIASDWAAQIGRTAAESPTHERSLVGRAKEYLSAHLDVPPSSREIARRMVVSREHLCRSFLKQTGMTLVEFLFRRRIERAKMRLQKPNTLVKEVALECGFPSTSEFDHVFHKLTGRKPTDYQVTVSQRKVTVRQR